MAPHLEMTRSEKEQTSRNVSKYRVELEPGDEGLRAFPGPRGFVSSTYDASTSLRRPRSTLARFVANCFCLTHDVLKYEVCFFTTCDYVGIYIFIIL